MLIITQLFQESPDGFSYHTEMIGNQWVSETVKNQRSKTVWGLHAIRFSLHNYNSHNKHIIAFYKIFEKKNAISYIHL